MKKARKHGGTEARRGGAPRGGFTLTELMVAIAVLVGVLLATSKIFSTTSKVTGMGQATADLMQEAAAIERQLRADIARLSHEGFFAIRCVAVANDVNVPFGYGLLDPTRDRDAVIRADQLVFFANGVQGVQTYRQRNPSDYTVGSNRKGQGTVARIYFGHAFQLGEESLPAEYRNDGWYAYDANQTVFPWAAGSVLIARTRFTGPQIFQQQGTDMAMNVPQVEARKWLLARQQVVLVDDGDFDNTNYLGQIVTARSLRLSDPDQGVWSPQIRDGRVDAAATQINDLRRMIKYQGTGFEQRWSDGQYPFIMNWDNGLVYYPRAERVAPSMHRIDQALTNNVISSACSSIKIDWTWKNGTGYARYWTGGSLVETAVRIRTDLEQPWFGMVDEQRGVLPYDTFDRWTGADTIFTGNPPNIEQYDSAIAPGKEPLVTYNALFGFNQDRPLVDNPDDANYGRPADYLAYTPWPSAIRVTLTLHDSKTTLEGGRELQFIIDLPRRATEFYQKR